MFSWIKKVVILVLMSGSNSKNNIIKNITRNFMVVPENNFLENQPKCISLKNQECSVKKVISDNDYITFPYKIRVDKCVGSCNDVDNPYFKVCLPDFIKNVSVKVFDLISQKTVLRNVSSHKSCKCGCLLDKKVCNNKQKWNKDKCRCECLKVKKCGNGFSWNVVNCRCESKRFFKKAAALITEKACDIETDDIVQNKTITLISKNKMPKTFTKCNSIENCKPFVASAILFVCVSVTSNGIMVYFYCKSKNNSVLPY